MKKKARKAWVKEQWCIPPKKNADFVYHREAILDGYHRPSDARYPPVCRDEGSKQVLAATREGEPMHPGKPACEDNEYERHGTLSVFVACEPLGGKRLVKVSKRRTKKDWAYFMRELIDEQYPEAEKLVLVLDKLNTHSPSSFSEVFDPQQARRLTEKVEVHDTPTHGSWFNMAAIERSVLARPCLAGRIPSLEPAPQRVGAWQRHRDHTHATIDWRFTTADARIKLKHLYPSIK